MYYGPLPAVHIFLYKYCSMSLFKNSQYETNRYMEGLIMLSDIKF